MGIAVDALVARLADRPGQVHHVHEVPPEEVALTQVWVHGFTKVEHGHAVQVDGYWRNARKGEDLAGKITKAGTAYTAAQRKKLGIKFVPPVLKGGKAEAQNAPKPPHTGSHEAGGPPVGVPAPHTPDTPVVPSEVPSPGGGKYARITAEPTTLETRFGPIKLEVGDEPLFEAYSEQGPSIYVRHPDGGFTRYTAKGKRKVGGKQLAHVQYNYAIVKSELEEGSFAQKASFSRFWPADYPKFTEFVDVKGVEAPEGDPPVSDPVAMADWALHAVLAAHGATTEDLADIQKRFEWKGPPMQRAKYWRDHLPDIAEEPGYWDAHRRMEIIADNLEHILGYPSQWNGKVGNLEGYKDWSGHPYLKKHPSVIGIANSDGSVYVTPPYAGQGAAGYNEHASASALVHEQVHEFSRSYRPYAVMDIDPGSCAYEEGPTEGFMRTHLEEACKGIPDHTPQHESLSWGAYQNYIDPMNQIADVLDFGDLHGLKGASHSERQAARREGHKRFYEFLVRLPRGLRREALMRLYERRKKEGRLMWLLLNDQKQAQRKFVEAIAALDAGKDL